jgi:hypothetical protein
MHLSGKIGSQLWRLRIEEDTAWQSYRNGIVTTLQSLVSLSIASLISM